MAERKQPDTVRRPSWGVAARNGALAGVVGGGAMMMATMMEEKALIPAGETVEPIPKRVVETELRKAGIRLSDRQAMVGGMAAHMMFSALLGAAFGLLERRRARPRLRDGLLLAGLVYLANFPRWGLLPRRRVVPPPSGRPLRQAAIPLGAHAAFGVTTAAALRTLRR